MGITFRVNESGQVEALAAKPKRARGWTFAAFRAWRDHEHPRSSYQIAPAVWRAEHFAQFAGEPDARRRALKNWEPRFTGMAYSDRAVYLVEVVKELTAENVGKALLGGSVPPRSRLRSASRQTNALGNSRARRDDVAT